MKLGFSIALMGEVDAGKSTTLGQILLQSKTLRAAKISEVAKTCAAANKDFEPAFLLDSFEQERVAEMTVDTTQVFCRWNDQDFIFFDTPGHRELSNKFLASACVCDFSILVIDPTTEINADRFRHINKLLDLGLSQFGIIITKIPIDGQQLFQETFEKVKKYLRQPAAFVCPVDGKLAAGFSRENAFKWFHDLPLLEALKQQANKSSLAWQPEKQNLNLRLFECRGLEFIEIILGQLKVEPVLSNCAIIHRNQIFKIVRIVSGELQNNFLNAPAIVQVVCSEKKQSNENQINLNNSRRIYLSQINLTEDLNFSSKSTSAYLQTKFGRFSILETDSTNTNSILVDDAYNELNIDDLAVILDQDCVVLTVAKIIPAQATQT